MAMGLRLASVQVAAIAPAAIDNVFALITLITDKDACKKRLEELQKAQDEIASIRAEAEVAEGEAYTAKEAAEKTAADQEAMQKTLAKEAAALDRRKARIDTEEAEVAKGAAKVTADINAFERDKREQKAAVDRLATNLEKDRFELDKRERGLDKREASVRELEEKTKAMAADYDKRLAQLKSLIGG